MFPWSKIDGGIFVITINGVSPCMSFTILGFVYAKLNKTCFLIHSQVRKANRERDHWKISNYKKRMNKKIVQPGGGSN